MEYIKIESNEILVKTYNTVIIGAGAAGLNCALHLVKEGIPPEKIAIITDKLGGGTSFNTGSDKQTYYKLSIIGDQKDSPLDMAKDLYSGGAMHGDIAMVEAVNSMREFFHLVELGVPFPHDEYGAFVGYKTDNDPRQRATSSGPLTSQKMCICLLKAVKEQKVTIFDNHYAIKIITKDGSAIGVICLNIIKLANDKDLTKSIESLIVFKAINVVMATGGPAQLYSNSVYPISQNGSMGLAIQAGCILQNLTESQFGLASYKFRWNVSGSYQQVIPRYFSKDIYGREYEFLNKYFPDFKTLSKAIFLKGYQWPFNPERIENYGSSLIDLAIFHETHDKARSVFLDYRANPLNYEFENLADLVKDYLIKSSATANTPIERLKQINEQAILLYKNNGIDLFKEPLGIQEVNQHLNGGVAGDIWYETNFNHLFAIGEINGSHGIHRPGGAALNAGQIGGLRAAQKIGYYYRQIKDQNENSVNDNLEHDIQSIVDELMNLINEEKSKKNDLFTLDQLLQDIKLKMFNLGGYIRDSKYLAIGISSLEDYFYDLDKKVEINAAEDVSNYYRLKDAFLSAIFILKSILEYHESLGGSRGSYLIQREELNSSYSERYLKLPNELGDYKFISSNRNFTDKILTIQLEPKTGLIKTSWVPVRPIPESLSWFEKVWKDYNSDGIFKK